MRLRFPIAALALLGVGFATAVIAQDATPTPSPAPNTAPPNTAAPPPTTTPAGPKTYSIDGKKTALVVQVFKDGAAAALAHDHTVHATEMSGEVVADPADPTTAKVSITAQTKSLVNDDPNVRKQFGLDPTVPDKDRKAVEESMKGDGQLEVAKFPTMSFVSTSVEKAGEKLTLVGDFTLHGVTKKIKMPITVKLGDNSVTGDGKVRFLQSEWGIKPYSAFLGAVKNKDELVLNVHIVAVAK